MADSDDSESEDEVIGGHTDYIEPFDGDMDSLQQNSGDVFEPAVESKKRAREDDPREDALTAGQDAISLERTTLMIVKPVEMLISSASFIVYSRNELKTIALQGECPLRDTFVLNPYFTGAVIPPACLSSEDTRSNSLHTDLFGERRPIRKSAALHHHDLCSQGYQLVAICVAQTSPTQSNPAFILAHVGAEVLTLHLYISDIQFGNLETDRFQNQEAKLSEMHMCDWSSMQELQTILNITRSIDECITIEQRRFLNKPNDTDVYQLDSNLFFPWFRLRLAHKEETVILTNVAKAFYECQKPSTDLLERHAYKSEDEPSIPIQTNALSNTILDAINSFLPIQFKTTLHSDTLVARHANAELDPFKLSMIDACILQFHRTRDVVQFCSVASAFLYHVPNPNPDVRFNATRSSIQLAIHSCNAPLIHTEQQSLDSSAMSVFTEEDLVAISNLWMGATSESMDSNEFEHKTPLHTKDESVFTESTASTMYEAIARQYMDTIEDSQTLTQRVMECLRNANVHTLVKETTELSHKYEWYDWATNQHKTIDHDTFACLVKHKNAIPIYVETASDNTTRMFIKKTLPMDIITSLKSEFQLLPDI